MKRRKFHGSQGVSEIVGTMLLLGISISLFSIVYISVLTVPNTPPTPSVNIACSLDNNNTINISHNGGKGLELNTFVLIKIGNLSAYKIIIDDILDEKSKSDNLWSVGEKITYFNVSLSGNQSNIEVIDPNSNAIIMIARFDAR